MSLILCESYSLVKHSGLTFSTDTIIISMDIYYPVDQYFDGVEDNLIKKGEGNRFLFRNQVHMRIEGGKKLAIFTSGGATPFPSLPHRSRVLESSQDHPAHASPRRLPGAAYAEPTRQLSWCRAYGW